MKSKQDQVLEIYSGWHLRALVILLLVLDTFFIPGSGSGAQGENFFVGSTACKGCHPEEYDNFMTYAKKSVSFQSIERQMKHLTQEEIRQCYPCHTTGYGKPGGFINPEETPHLKNAGCEVCHGPGEDHCKNGDPEKIISRMSKKDCEVCHISERVKAFKYKPLIHGGAH